MAQRKWGTVRAGSQLVMDGGEMTRVHNDAMEDLLVEPLVLGAEHGDYLTGFGGIVRGYTYGGAVEAGYWPGISGGVLTVNDVSAAHEFIVSSGVLTLDDGAVLPDAAIFNPGNVLLVND